MKKIFFFSMAVCFVACQKKVANTSQTNSLITQAQNYFNGVLSQKLAPNAGNYRANRARNPEWDQAQVKNLSVGQVVEVPVHFAKQLYVSTGLDGPYLLDLNAATKLVLFKDSAGQFHYQVLTLIPDSNSIAHPGMFTGIVLAEDWSGNSLSTTMRIGEPATGSGGSSRPITDDATNITTCTEIDGYNYAADDPDDGYGWSESTCTTYGFEAESGGGYLGYNEGDYSGLASSGGGTYSIAIPPPTSPIANIANYFGCFTNVGGTDHNYNISVCVAQPDPGTRMPWVFYSSLPTSSDAGNLVNVGHTFLILTETYGTTTITRNVGFVPSTIVSPPLPSSPGVFNDDESHNYNISGIFTLTNAQFFSVLNYITGLNNAVDTYNLNSNNCTTFAVNAMYQAGVNLPRTVGSWLGGAGYDPGDLGQDMLATSIPGMTLSISGSSHPNVGQCN